MIGVGLFGPGMHQFVLDEMEVGFRAAVWLDEEEAEVGMAWLIDIQYAEYCREHEID